MADEEHLAILKQGVEVWNAWRRQHPKVPRPNLGGADLFRARLDGANFARAILDSANLARARLHQTSLTSAFLAYTNFAGAFLTGASLKGAILYETILVDIDLSRCEDLEGCIHYGPSIIDIRTLQRSGPLPLAFLRGVGLPDRLIDYLPSLLNQAIQMYSCFISYSAKDEDFAQRLNADLQGKGVRCWFAPHDMRIGDKIRSRLDQAVRLHEKLLLVLSENSIASTWVEKEVETAFERERETGATVLFPVRLDDAVMDVKVGWAADIKRSRHIGDFRQWKDHDAYAKTLERLLRDLRVEKGGSLMPPTDNV